VSLGEALPQEINRVRALQDEYKAMRRMPGLLVEPAIALMEASIQNAVRVSTEGDVVEMLRAYEDLKGFTG
jgi:hypothetical protein